eukprot:NODE_85_length_22232_cov_1.318619.p4 type:complete len:366 gc:universal NODE_85_length_22232_cov_1.318619:14201-13104(-)
MSDNINVNPNVDDAFYRYKMPRIQSKTEGRGNGIKTVIPNMQEIGKALHRRSDYITKFFGFELGSQTIVSDRYIVNGQHDASKLQTILSGFIKKFVLCPKCDNPETDLVVEGSKKKSTIYQVCVACGHKESVDMTHRLTTYIIRNPPDTENKEIYDEEETGEVVEGMGDLEIDETAINLASESDDNDGEWTTSRRVDLDTNMSSWLQVQDPIKAFSEQVATQDVKVLLKQLEITRKDAIIAAVVTLLNDAQFIEKNLIPSHEKIWNTLIMKKQKVSKKNQKYLLVAIEILVSNTNPKLMPSTSGFLLQFYDLGLLKKDIVKKWYNSPSKKFAGSLEKSNQVRKQSERFLSFLNDQESSAESSDSE